MPGVQSMQCIRMKAPMYAWSISSNVHTPNSTIYSLCILNRHSIGTAPEIKRRRHTGKDGKKKGASGIDEAGALCHRVSPTASTQPRDTRSTIVKAVEDE